MANEGAADNDNRAGRAIDRHAHPIRVAGAARDLQRRLRERAESRTGGAPGDDIAELTEAVAALAEMVEALAVRSLRHERD